MAEMEATALVDLEEGVAVAGQPLKGVVQVKIANAEPGSSVVVLVRARGSEFISFKPTHVDGSVKPFSKENLFHDEGVASEEKTLTAAEGSFSVPFSAIFPSEVCCGSFAYQHRLGYDAVVSYALECTVVQAEKTLCSTTQLVHVLEAVGSRLHPLVVRDEKRYLLAKGSLQVSLHLGRNAFCRGKAIPVQVHVLNTSGRDVHGITVQLKRKLVLQVPNTVTKRQVTEVYSKKHSMKIVSDVTAKEEQRVELTLPLDDTIDPTVNGKWVNVQYCVAVSLSVGGMMTSDVHMQVPIMIYAPQLEALMESHGSGIVDADGKKVADGEFCFPPDAGNQKEDTAQQLAPGQSLKGSVFYRTGFGFFIDVANSSGIGELSLVLDITASADIGVHGRFGAEPTVLEWDISEAPQSEGKWTLALNRYSVPRLSPGRWFFTVLGKSLLQTSDFEVTYSLQSLKQSRLGLMGNRVEDVIYESERRLTPFTQFGRDASLPLWSMKSGVACPAPEDFPLPDFNWYWEDAWAPVVKEGVTDANGWRYARSWVGGGRRADCNAACFVRRRVWKRTRVVKTKEIKKMEEASKEDVALELEGLVDEFEHVSVEEEALVDLVTKISAAEAAEKEGKEVLVNEEEKAEKDIMEAKEEEEEREVKAETEEKGEDRGDKKRNEKVAARPQSASLISLEDHSEDPQSLACGVDVDGTSSDAEDCAFAEATGDLLSFSAAPTPDLLDLSGAAEPQAVAPTGLLPQDLLSAAPEAVSIVEEQREEKAEPEEAPAADITLVDDELTLKLEKIHEEAEKRAAERKRREAAEEERRQEEERAFQEREKERLERLEETKRERAAAQAKQQQEWLAKEEEMRRQMQAEQDRLQSLLGGSIVEPEVPSAVSEAAEDAPVTANTEVVTEHMPSPGPVVAHVVATSGLDDEELDSMFEAVSDDEDDYD